MLMVMLDLFELLISSHSKLKIQEILVSTVRVDYARKSTW